MRVPTGSAWALISTAALRSNRITEPSGRLMSFDTRTTTAFITSPFLTRPRGIASLTETTMVSPTVAYLRFEPPSTLMHMTRRAPELSATSRLVCIWIMTGLVVCRCARRASLRALLAARHRPALQSRDRPVLLDPDNVADRELVVLVVRVVVLGAPHRLLQERMGEAALDADDHGLVLLVAHHRALQHAFRHSGLLTSPWLRRRASAGQWSGCGRCRAAPAAPARCSRADRSPAGSAG